MEKEGRKNLLRLRIWSDPKYIAMVRAITEEIARSVGFSFDEGFDLKLAINEAIANIYEHSYEGAKDKPIFIYFNWRDNGLEIILRDFGKQTPPEEIKPRNLEEFKDGGLGVFLIKTLVDEVKWEPCKGVGMRTILYKKPKI